MKAHLNTRCQLRTVASAPPLWVALPEANLLVGKDETPAIIRVEGSIDHTGKKIPLNLRVSAPGFPVSIVAVV